jgi:glycosyltransferase involved in cell wall biosynthesis
VSCKCIVLSLGPPHDAPWWWDQIVGTGLQQCIHYERISLGEPGRRRSGLSAIPSLALRLVRLLRAARHEGVSHILTFESDLTCYLIGLLQYWPGLREPRHVIVQFIASELSPGPGSRAKHFVRRVLLNTVFLVICSSRDEVAYYREIFRWPASRTAFVPFHTDARLLDVQPIEDEPPFVLSAGRSYRDFAVLARAVAGTGIRTEVVCGRGGPRLAKVPAEMQIIEEMPLPDLMERMRRASIVVLSLEPKRISTGQTVLLQAMAHGKAVVATASAGTTDYIESGLDGVLVPPGDADALRDAICTLWQDPTARVRMGERARRRIAEQHLPEHYALNVRSALTRRGGLRSP